MDKGLIHLDMIFPSHHQPSKVAPPCQGAFDFPSSLVATQGASILGGWFGSIFAMRTDQLNPPSCQSCAQRIGIGDLVVDQPGRIFPRSTATAARLPAPRSARSTRLRLGTPSPSSFPEEHLGRLPPPSTLYPFRVWSGRHRPPFFRRGKTAVGKRLPLSSYETASTQT